MILLFSLFSCSISYSQISSHFIINNVLPDSLKKNSDSTQSMIDTANMRNIDTLAANNTIGTIVYDKKSNELLVLSHELMQKIQDTSLAKNESAVGLKPGLQGSSSQDINSDIVFDKKTNELISLSHEHMKKILDPSLAKYDTIKGFDNFRILQVDSSIFSEYYLVIMQNSNDDTLFLLSPGKSAQSGKNLDSSLNMLYNDSIYHISYRRVNIRFKEKLSDEYKQIPHLEIAFGTIVFMVDNLIQVPIYFSEQIFAQCYQSEQKKNVINTQIPLSKTTSQTAMPSNNR